MANFDESEVIIKLNKFKSSIDWTDKGFDRKFFNQLFRNSGLPVNNAFWQVFKSCGLLKETARGRWTFAFKGPVYVGALTKIKQQYSSLANKYAKTAYNNRKAKEAREIEEKKYSELEKAINLLKENGYVIYKPV